MSLHRFTSQRLLLLLGVLVVAGCAGSGSRPDGSAAAERSEPVAAQETVLPEIPPEELAPGLTVTELPHRFRVATMINLVKHFLDELRE